MKPEIFRKDFFLYAKMMFLVVILATTVLKMNRNGLSVCIYLLITALFYSASILVEEVKQRKLVMVLLELLLLWGMYQLGYAEAVYYGPVVLLDFIIQVRLPVYLCLLACLVPMALSNRLTGIDSTFLWLEAVFAGMMYYQEVAIVQEYKKEIRENNAQESMLKHDMESAKRQHESQMKQSRLSFENRMLMEKAEISQALHDKLGHSINGSLYQLEACKVIMEAKPEESKKILQAVIDTLRTSMDEIRLILRRENPDKRQMALMQLRTLCEECKEKYRIDAGIKIKGDEELVAESLWEVILDNAYEAVSNALKYAKCSQITIEILVLNEVVRCSIKDNGIGCQKLEEGMGLQGMKRRVRSVNGYLNVESSMGFMINMILPLSQGLEGGK